MVDVAGTPGDDRVGAAPARSPGIRDFRVALVYPPFGPSGLPSLGLGLLSAGVKKRGMACRTFYWNLDFVTQMPGGELKDRLASYYYLTSRNWMPFSEWTFSRLVHDDALAPREHDLLRRLDDIAAAAGRHDKEAACLKDQILSLRERAGDLVARMVDRLAPYSVVGINTTFYQNLPALALARGVKARWPDKTVVLGGANCDGEMGAALLERFDFVDYVFSGEVDHAFPDFALRRSRAEPVDDIPGLVRREGARVTGRPAEPLMDLDALPLPDFDDYVAERKRIELDQIQQVVLALESSRGCWWGAHQHCTFCGLNAMGMGYRHKQAERFQSEVETIVNRYGASFIFMTDNILPMKYYDRFMTWASRAGLRTNFFYEIKSNVTRRHVALLADAGVTAVQPGIESFSSKILSLMRKGTTGIQNIALL
jgi:ribosomal peptide maturation radical SAM protein 1